MVITGVKPVLITPRNMIKSMQIDTRRHQNTKKTVG